MEWHFSPIGFVHGGGQHPQEAPRQSVWAHNEGYIELLPGHNFEAALPDLQGFDRIWVVAVFDRNNTWKPLVRPPYGVNRKISLFATRAPYRPNPIALSAVELVKVEKLRLYIRNFDLLDGTPVLDLKPYIPQADAFPDSAAGWRDNVPAPGKLELSAQAQQAAEFIAAHGGPDLVEVAQIQLAAHDFDPTRLRLEMFEATHGIFAYRTWRLEFFRTPECVKVERIFSGYTPPELAPQATDPYQDKTLHRAFVQRENH